MVGILCFLLGWPIFTGKHVSFGECKHAKTGDGDKLPCLQKMGRRGISLPCQPRGMMVEVGVVKVDVEQVFLVHV